MARQMIIVWNAVVTSGGISTKRQAVCAIAAMAPDMFMESLAPNVTEQVSSSALLGIVNIRAVVQ